MGERREANDNTDGRARTADILDVLQDRPDWPTAMARLRERYADDGAEAHHQAARYGQRYAGQRGAMVVDVIGSRRRPYLSRVSNIVAAWRAQATAPTLAWLANNPPDAAPLGLMAGEPETMRQVAANLAAFASTRGLGEDEGCRVWADAVDGLEHAPGLDPVVGGVAGIGPALFAYMRMRCGGNAIKPDVRVGSALRRLGFALPDDPHAILVVAKAAAAELGVDLLTLDQLLWWGEQPPDG